METCRSPLYSDDEDRAGLVLFVGSSDAHGVPSEVVGIEIADDVLLIIHAIRLRARNRDDYDWVMRWFEQ